MPNYNIYTQYHDDYNITYGREGLIISLIIVYEPNCN
jgi:hypothetical protein